jgi:nucleoside-diphosphate-sugar epimerase
MSLLIIGSGLVGSQIARLEIEQKKDHGEKPIIFDVAPRIDALRDIFEPDQATIIQGDVLNAHDLYRAIKSNGVTRVIHTAANPLLTVGAQKMPYQAIQLNIMGTANVLEAARLFNLERVVFTSSNVIAHYTIEGPFGLPMPSTIYSATKLACEHLGLNYHRSYGLDFVAVRFSAVVGPWRYGGGGGPTQRFKEMLERSLKKEVASFPSSRQEYVYSKDAASGCFLAAHADKSSIKKRVYNISMGRVYGGEEIKSIVEKEIPGSKVELSKETATGISVDRMEPADLSASKEEIGFVPKFDMAGSVKDYVGWLKGHGY